MSVVDGGATVTVRPMAGGDLPAVVVIERAAYPRPPWSAQAFAAELDRADRCYLVAVERDRVVAFAGALVADDEAQVLTVAVAPERQRRGVGRRLVGALEEELRRRGVGSVTLEVRTGNAAARTLYRRLRYVPVGRRPGYYQDGEDALLMWKLLTREV